ncbi:MAG TPA: helix-turn-helix transcriptional regulator [Candidatus Avanaerovorax faecigallinarum]|nr:helix-turn-helix transcriptional regulator [Candidatus Avanaerovorax faecigallinarum]
MAARIYIKPELKEFNLKHMGRRIRAQRELLEMTREDLAFATDLSPKFIAEIEYGNRGISLRNLYKISQVLNVTCDYLISGSYTGVELEEHVSRIAEDVLEPMVDFSPDEVKFMESIANSYKILRKKLNNRSR